MPRPAPHDILSNIFVQGRDGRRAEDTEPGALKLSIGKAGDPLPPFEHHMIRQRVTFQGAVFPLDPEEELPGCTVERDHVGIVKVGPVRKWLEHKRRWDTRFRRTEDRIRKRRLEEMMVGYAVFGDGEVPPPSALAGRRKLGGEELEIKKKVRSLGLALWSLWGSKHDQMTMQREQNAGTAASLKSATAAEGEGARTFSDMQRQEKVGASSKLPKLVSLKPSNRRHVTDEHQVLEDIVVEEDADSAPAMPTHSEQAERDEGKLWPGHAMSEKRATGKRVFIEGLATPFSLRKEAETASMITLQPSRPTTPGPNKILDARPTDAAEGEVDTGDDEASQGAGDNGTPDPDTTVTTPFATPLVTPGLVSPTGERPGLEMFVTAQEVPLAKEYM